VLLTGASRGIGRALAAKLAGQGAKLILVARSEPELLELGTELSAQGAEVFFRPADVSDRHAVKGLVEAGGERFGRLDVLINNAGVGLRARIPDIRPEDFSTAWEVNVLGPLLLIQAAWPWFKRQSGGLIINICSLGALQPAPNIGGYSATKAALAALGAATRLELAPFGVRVCNVFPGSAATSFRAHALGEAYPENEPRLSRVSPDLVAQRILIGAARGERDIFVTWPDRVLATFARLAPVLTDRLVARAFKRVKER
jgi:short-subunit dehydrogenase